MSAIHVLCRAPWDKGDLYEAPTGNHFWHFAHGLPSFRLTTPDGNPIGLQPVALSDEGKRAWVAMSRPVLQAVIPELGGKPRYQRIPTLYRGMTVGQFAGWHHEVARRVREMAGKREVLAVWDEADYYRLRCVKALVMEYAAVVGGKVGELGNPFAMAIRGR